MADPRVRRACIPAAVGGREVFRRAGWTPALAPLLDLGPCGPFPAGPSAEGGRISYAAVRAAVSLCARGLAEGIVTAPICKESWRLAGTAHLDHTALFEALACRPVAMLLSAGSLRAVLATRHLPLKDVPASLGFEALSRAALLLREALTRDLGLREPRIGLCALNPHAGENGLLGREELDLLAPAAARLRRMGVGVEGPLSADAAWAAHAKGSFDALIALYHDQAMIPLKASGAPVVNRTLGIPFARTSPGHGTAFDAAWRGRADCEPTVQAALLACEAAVRRKGCSTI
jgi:4-hydroxythreonine-4-phosphate dehydrogenase